MLFRRLVLILAIAVASTMLITPGTASAAQEWGSSKKWPWSGYWWPMLDNGYNLYANNGPLQKYDQWLSTYGIASQAQSWERQNHYTNDPKDDWWGYCHAWSTAAILSPEPRAVTRNGVTFNVNDTKGLVTALYYEPTFNWLSGVRVDNAGDTNSAAYRDIAPAWMDYLLRYYIRYHQYPFIMDINADSQVWNYPVFAYQRNSTALANGGEQVTTTVWYASPDWNTTGTRYFPKTYTYRLDPGSLGEWTGNSVQDHPDFAWAPNGKRAGTGTNPWVTESNIEALTGLDV